MSDDIFNAKWILNEFRADITSVSGASSFVYFISDGSNAIKIGKANDILRRIDALQIGNPQKLKCLYMIPATHTAITNLEHGLHFLYKEHRACGEWFLINDKLDHNSFEKHFSASPYISGGEYTEKYRRCRDKHDQMIETIREMLNVRVN